MSTADDIQEYFGRPWGDIGSVSGVIDVRIPTPTGAVCMHCASPIRKGEQGLRFPTGRYSHRECGLRSALGGIGHQVDCAYYCKGELGPDAGIAYRDSALLVWDWYMDGHLPTKQDLEVIRRVKHGDE